MSLLHLLSFLGVFHAALMAILTSEHQVKELIRFERNLIDSLDNYFTRQEKNGITFDSAVTSFVKDMHLKNRELPDRILTTLENPLSSYHVTKRLVNDWSSLKENLTCTGEDCPLLTGEDVFNALFKREKRALPTQFDFEDAALTLLHIWDVYDLDIAELATGIIRDIQDKPLSADDIFFISSVAKDAGKFYSAIKWFEFLMLVKKDTDLSQTSFKVAHVYRKLASCYHEYGMTWKAIEVLDEYQKKDPDNKAVLADLKFFKSSARTARQKVEVKRFDDENSKIVKIAENYKKLCQESLERANSTALLSCFFQPLSGAYGVSRHEILSLRPRIILIYDAIDNNETNVLMKYAEKNWQKKTEQLRQESQKESWTSRWFCERRPQYSFLDTLSDRIEVITNLKLWPFHDNPSSECYQFHHKGVGESSVITKDYWRKEEAEAYPDVINRYVTIKLQLSDVQYGGATIFPKLDITVPIIKNSAVLWWNLKDDGTPNPKTAHVDCPVIAGVNWSLTKKVFYRNQMKIRKCISRHLPSHARK